MSDELDPHIRLQQKMEPLIIQEAPTELWDSTEKIDAPHTTRSSKAAHQSQLRTVYSNRIGYGRPTFRPKMIRPYENQLGGVKFEVMIGHPGVGKSTLSRQMMKAIMYPQSPNDVHAPILGYQTGEARVPMSEIEINWGSLFTLLPDWVRVPGDADDQFDPEARLRKQFEVLYVSELMKAAASIVVCTQSREIFTVGVIDNPGFTGVSQYGIDRGTGVLRDLANRNGAFSQRTLNRVREWLKRNYTGHINLDPRVDYLDPSHTCVVGAPEVLEHNLHVRAGIFDQKGTEAQLQHLAANGVTLTGLAGDLDEKRTQIDQTIERYVIGSARPVEIEQLHKNVRAYMRQRMVEWGWGDHADQIMEHYLRDPFIMQNDLAYKFYPDFVQNVLQLPNPENVIILMNKIVQPQVSYPVDIAQDTILNHVAFLNYVEAIIRPIMENVFRKNYLPKLTLLLRSQNRGLSG